MGDALSIFFSATPGYEARLLGSAWMVSTGEPVVDLNCAAIVSQESASEILREFHSALASLQVPFMICLADEVAAALESVAKSLGLQSAGRVQVMSFETDRLEPARGPEGLSIERVASVTGLQNIARLSAEIFGLPLESLRRVFAPKLLERTELAIYQATMDGEPAGVAVLTHHEPYVGIWSMGTAAEFRRRGVGSSLLIHAMHEQLGPASTTFFLLPTPQGLPLYERIGFRTATTGQVWAGLATSPLEVPA
jgi:N-acetylglutamate synthase